MITCRDCSRQFAKPAQRGHPPVRCEDCRNGVTVKPSAVVSETVISEPAPTPDPVKVPRNKKIVTGFCNPRHDESIHLMCGARFGCVCDCHK